jgi:cytochrome c oxidase assembly protein Cox11
MKILCFLEGKKENRRTALNQTLTHIVENIAYAFWEKTNIRCFTPNQKVEGNQYDFPVLIYCFKAKKR